MNGLLNNLMLADGGAEQWLHDVWFKPGNSNLTAEVDWMYMLILWISIISFFILMIPMTWWAIRYRRRAGVPAIRTPNHNLMLEITWIVVPLIIMTYIFFKGFHGYMDSQITPGSAEEISVTGKKWNWTATYDNGANSPVTVRFDTRQEGDKIITGNADMPLFVVPAGKPVRFRLHSDDVIHSFFIPDMRVKIDVMPNRYTSFTVTPLAFTGPDGVDNAAIVDAASATKQANLSEFSLLEDKSDKLHRDHVIYCAEYCGTNHSEMAGVLRVVPQADYDRIKAQWGNIDDILKKDPVKLGEIVYKARGCAACHSTDGSGSTGPTWKDSYGKALNFEAGARGKDFAAEFAKDPFLAWDNYIEESILDPQAKIHKEAGKDFSTSKMPSFQGQVTRPQIEGVISFFRSMSTEWAKKNPNVKPGDEFQKKALDAEAAKKKAEQK